MTSRDTSRHQDGRGAPTLEERRASCQADTLKRLLAAANSIVQEDPRVASLVTSESVGDQRSSREQVSAAAALCESLERAVSCISSWEEEL